MPWSQEKRDLADYALLVGAGFLYAISLKYFVLPSKVILTGTEGIAASLSYFFEKKWLFIVLYAVFQALLLGFAYKAISRRFARRSAAVVATVLLGLSLLPELQFAKPEPENERILLVIFGGILAGLAKAMAFRRRGSTGDEDILGAYFAMKYLKPVGFVAIFSAAVSTCFGVGLDLLKTHQFEAAINTLMYTGVYIFVSAETLNNFYRKFRLTMATIILKEPDRLGAAIKEALPHRTYTTDEGLGGHSKEQFWVMRVLLTHEELPDLLQVIERTAPKSFYYHHKVDGISSQYYIEPIG